MPPEAGRTAQSTARKSHAQDFRHSCSRLRTSTPSLLCTSGQLRESRAYPAFRGWSWASDWYAHFTGEAAAQPGAENDAYAAALAAAEATGAWSTVFDTVSDRVFALWSDAEAMFRTAMNAVTPGRISAMTGYANVEFSPPLVLGNADEIDLHFQYEQLQPPMITAHEVDLLRRPGKPLWGHPELQYNDDGTGGMMLPTLLLQVMRGVNGTGTSGDAGAMHTGGFPNMPERTGGTGPKLGDPRSGGAGKTSVLRAGYELISRFAPAVAAARSADPIAIVVSSRMHRIDTGNGQQFTADWNSYNGTIASSAYFDSLYEAYCTCLYAHRPASFVYAEDASAGVLSRYGAVLVVHQRVELEPRLADALGNCGIPVYFDGTSRPALLSRFQPLGITFDQVTAHPTPKNNDAAFSDYRTLFLNNAATLATILDFVPPIAECDQPEVLLTERVDGDTRYLWVVNNTILPWDPGLMARVGLLMTHRVPLLANLKVDLPLGYQVVDVITGEIVSVLDGTFTADLRTLPARLYAIVPLSHAALPEPLPNPFGPHVRDIAVSADGASAMLSCFNWDHNLYGIDLTTGLTTWRRKIGHHYSYAPAAWPNHGFAAQGYDVLRAEGYHLYQLDDTGMPNRRFALFGLPKRATDSVIGEFGYDTGLNNFAVSPTGEWVATCGDIGIAVWDAQGSPLWARDWATPTAAAPTTGLDPALTRRQPLRLLAADSATLLTFADGVVTALAPSTGAQLWQITDLGAGAFLGGLLSGDGQTVVLWSETEGGRVFLIRGGTLVSTIASAVDEVTVSHDGSVLAATYGKQLKAFDTATGLLWTFTGDDLLRRPRVSPDGSRIAVGSELGTLTVLTSAGAELTSQDLRALPVSDWLPQPDGTADLLVATWMGTVLRLDADLNQRWQTTLAPTETNIAATLNTPAKDPTPTSYRTGWGNAAATPSDLTPNLIVDAPAVVTAWLGQFEPAWPAEDQYAVALHDGKPTPPTQPWLNWANVNAVNVETPFSLKVDTIRTQVRLDQVTFAEDPAYPQSWLRDVLMQWWDPESETWNDGAYLLWDQDGSSTDVVHTHSLQPLTKAHKPIEAARFRLVTTGGGLWPSGNIRLGELVFQGEILGCSHRDVVHNRPLATLFDTREGDIATLYAAVGAFTIRQDGGLGGGAGGKCIELAGTSHITPVYLYWNSDPNYVPFGEAMIDWDFEIAENPQEGTNQYRYLQFAWQAASTNTTGIGLRIGQRWELPAFVVNVGDPQWALVSTGYIQQVPGSPPTNWTTVRVDLWELLGANPAPPIRCLDLRSDGDGARFAQIVLGRTTDVLPPQLT